MGKLLEVKEFDTITGNADYANDEKYKYLEQPAFDGLIEFIHEYAGDEENADAFELMKISYKRNVGEVVTIKNYVGLIQMKNGAQVQVLPKVSFGDGADEDNTRINSITYCRLFVIC